MAQGVKDLSLNEAIAIAKENSWNVNKYQAEKEISSAELFKTRSAFLPSIKLSNAYVTTNDPLHSFGLKLKQRSPTIQDFDPKQLNDPDRIENFSTTVEFQQPIFNYDAIFVRKAAREGVAAMQDLVNWNKKIAELKARELYFQLILSKRKVEVLETSLNTIVKISSDVLDNFNEGFLIKSDLMATQLKVTEAESRLIEAQNLVEFVNNELVHFLNLPYNTRINATENILLLPPDPELFTISEISHNRDDLKALKNQLDAKDHLLRSSFNGFIPRLNAFGKYEWNDPGLVGFKSDMYMVGAKLEWDIFSGGKKIGQTQKQKAQKVRSEIEMKEKFSLANKELAHVKNQIQLIEKQLELSTLSIMQAEESYKIKKNRFDEGLEKTSEILSAEDVLLTKNLQLSEFQNTYNLLVSKLELLIEGSQL
jgi:outer membrane protein TolC